MRPRRLIVLFSSLAPFLAGPSAAAVQHSSIHSSMSMSYPIPLVLQPRSGVHKSTLIFLHGLGDSGNLACLHSSAQAGCSSVPAAYAWHCKTSGSGVHAYMCIRAALANHQHLLKVAGLVPTFSCAAVICRGRLGRCGRV